MPRAAATPPADEPTEDSPADEPVADEPEAEAPAEENTPAPSGGSWRVLARVQYTDKAGNEFICGPGEVIDDAAAAQVDADSIAPAG